VAPVTGSPRFPFPEELTLWLAPREKYVVPSKLPSGVAVKVPVVRPLIATTQKMHPPRVLATTPKGTSVVVGTSAEERGVSV
jgi:hypothetical protein